MNHLFILLPKIYVISTFYDIHIFFFFLYSHYSRYAYLPTEKKKHTHTQNQFLICFFVSTRYTFMHYAAFELVAHKMEFYYKRSDMGSFK